jgi:hypothetical protein
MPYYVYAVKPLAQLEKLAEFPAFRQASAHAKSLRAGGRPGERIKVMFADTPLAAEDLLLQVRDAPPDGDD